MALPWHSPRRRCFPLTGVKPNKAPYGQTLWVSLFFWSARRQEPVHAARIFEMTSWSMSMNYDLHLESFYDGSPTESQFPCPLRKNTSFYAERRCMPRQFDAIKQTLCMLHLFCEAYKGHAQDSAESSKLLYQSHTFVVIYHHNGQSPQRHMTLWDIKAEIHHCIFLFSKATSGHLVFHLLEEHRLTMKSVYLAEETGHISGRASQLALAVQAATLVKLRITQPKLTITILSKSYYHVVTGMRRIRV